SWGISILVLVLVFVFYFNYSNLPILRSFLNVFPSKRFFALCLHLVVKWLRIMVIYKFKSFTGSDIGECLIKHLVSLRRRKWSQVKFINHRKAIITESTLILFGNVDYKLTVVLFLVNPFMSTLKLVDKDLMYFDRVFS